MFFHSADLKTMAEVWESALASQKDEDEVDAELGFLQSSPEEKDALEALVNHDFALKNTGEWEDFQEDPSGISFGTSEDDEAMNILDELEMIHDMNAFECESAAHELFAENPWKTRSYDTRDISKKSEATIGTKITCVGDSYATGTSLYGKVYIPTDVLNGSGNRNMCASPTLGDVINVRARFQGFEDCRGKLMPWRAQYVI